MKSKLTIGLLVGATMATAVFAHGGAEGVVKERMDAMSAMGQSVKKLAPMMRGETDYDAAAVRAAARVFIEHSDGLTELFPEGSDSKPSEAKPEIWSEWDKFSALADQLKTASEGLAEAAGNGLMASGANLGAGSMMGTQSSGGGMMGTSSMMGTASDGGMMDYASMPADGAFNMVTQTCSSCHAKFRFEAK
ncbi:cytochrome c [Thioclava sp. F28-4]|uniref:c-type cytochrome n=1 Tax=Thioclava sp. F28-4 TaxID=1915315 RepID=UPI000997C4EE|nr:cytochrome c [Thioclava sp. F28-4]OOY05392.1 cytochrome C [Thioclava sp. F28-4]